MVHLASQAVELPARIYLQNVVQAVSSPDELSAGPAPNARAVSAFCQQLGMQPTKDRLGRWVLFEPAAHAAVLEQFGLAPEGGEEQAA
jgi:hypothetical protein